MQKQNDFQTSCPECGCVIHLDARLQLAHLLLCPNCETLLIVVAVEPRVVVDWAFEEPDASVPPFMPYFPRHLPDWH